MKLSKLTNFFIGLVVLAPFVLATFSLSHAKNDKGGVIVLTSHNTVVLDSVVDGDSVGDVLAQARKLDKKSSVLPKWISYGRYDGPIYLYMDTPGGSVQSGLELIEGLNGLHRPVYTVSSFAASMGMQIVQSVNGDRLIVKNGILMSHRGSGGFEGEFGGQEPSQIYNRYRIWAQRLKEMDEQTVKRTNGKQTLASYQKAYDQELWVTGSEAVAQGYADRIVSVRCDSSLDGVNTRMVMFMDIPIYYDVDKCPINSTPRNIRLELLTNKGYMTVDQFRSSNGRFGALCLEQSALDKSKICTVDTTVSYEKIEQIKKKFMESFSNKEDHVIPMNTL